MRLSVQNQNIFLTEMEPKQEFRSYISFAPKGKFSQTKIFIYCMHAFAYTRIYLQTHISTLKETYA